MRKVTTVVLSLVVLAGAGGLLAAQTPDKDECYVAGKIVKVQSGAEIRAELGEGEKVTVLGTQNAGGKAWAKVATASGVSGFVDASRLRAPVPTPDGAAKNALPDKALLALVNDYYLSDKGLSHCVSPSAVRITVESSSKTKELIGALKFKVGEAKKAKADSSDTTVKAALDDAAKAYEEAVRILTVLDELGRLTDEDYRSAWLKDAGLTVFVNVILPAVEIAFPPLVPVVTGVQLGVEASGVREKLKGEKLGIEKKRDLQDKVTARLLGRLDSVRSGAATLWLARTKEMEVKPSGGLHVGLQRYCCDEGFGYHAVGVWSFYDKPLTNCVLKVEIKGEKEEGTAYLFRERWDGGERALLKCDNSGVKLEDNVFGKVSVSKPAKVTAWVVCDQFDHVAKVEYDYTDSDALDDLALFYKKHVTVKKINSTYNPRPLFGDGGCLAATFEVSWPEGVAEIEKLRDIDLTFNVRAGDRLLGTLSDVVGTNVVTATPRKGVILVSRPDLGTAIPDAVELLIRPKGSDCLPAGFRFEHKAK